MAKFKRRPRQLTDEEAAQLAEAHAVADAAPEYLAAAGALEESLRGALVAIERIKATGIGRVTDDIDYDPLDEDDEGEFVPGDGIGIESDIDVKAIAAEYRRARARKAVFMAKWPTGHGRLDMREAVLVNQLRDAGWSDRDITWEIIDWLLVDRAAWDPGNPEHRRAYMKARETARRAAQKRLKRIRHPNHSELELIDLLARHGGPVWH
jgi:hypothetical protein